MKLICVTQNIYKNVFDFSNVRITYINVKQIRTLHFCQISNFPSESILIRVLCYLELNDSIQVKIGIIRYLLKYDLVLMTFGRVISKNVFFFSLGIKLGFSA